ncbi:sigma-70 family RNA polymerase sigma factor [Streptomyces sp. NPDC006638]|uniref:sigma-70 family RNA polymerase sigma factor n=1 Tax=Streptomyces sp. NPDC006638 TaxID=3157183 RepID=UPI0033B0155B
MSRAKVTDEQISAAQGGDSDAMWAIVSAYEHLMMSVVRSVAPAANAEDVEDLLQEARAVLIQRVRDYRSSASSAELHTFAYPAIRLAVTEAWVRSSTGLTVDPTTVLRVKRALWESDGDRNAAWTMVSTCENPRHRMDRLTFMGAVESLAGVLGLDSPGRGDGGGTGEWTLKDEIADTSADFVDVSERRSLARYLLSEIAPRQSLALRAYYGIGMTQATDAEIGDDMGIKVTAVRKLRSNGILSARAVAASQALAA